MKHTKCKRTTNGDRKCETKHVYKEKCTEILAFKPKGFSAKKGARGPKPSKGGLVQAEASGKVAHSVCTGNQAVKITAATYGQSCGAPNNNAYMAMAQKCNGITQCHYPINIGNLGDPAPGCEKNFVWQYKCVNDVESSRSGAYNYNEFDGVGLHLKEGRWDNTFCHRQRVPICQKPRGEVINGYIGVRAARTYQQASQWCQDWYGTHLATIRTDAEGINAQKACQALDVMNNKHCWIGMVRPFKRWNSGVDIKPFENWSPGEPNNWGKQENCVELYGKNGKWNDLGCGARRFFLCDVQTGMQRMMYEDREKLITKRMTVHRRKWKAHRREEYRRKVRKEYMNMIRKHKRNLRKQRKQMLNRQREALRQRAFKKQFGGFMAMSGKFMGGTRQMDYLAGTAQKKRRKRQAIRMASEKLSRLLQRPPSRIIVPRNNLKRIRMMQQVRLRPARPQSIGGITEDRVPLCPLGFTNPKGRNPGRVCLVRNNIRRPPRLSRRRLMSEPAVLATDTARITQSMVDKIHEDNDHDALITNEKRIHLRRRRIEEEMSATYGIGEYLSAETIGVDNMYPQYDQSQFERSNHQNIEYGNGTDQSSISNFKDGPSLLHFEMNIDDDEDDNGELEDQDLQSHQYALNRVAAMSMEKCLWFYNNAQVYQLCIGIQGLEVKQFVKAERKATVPVIAKDDNDTLFSLNVTEDDYLNFMEYEDLKYKVTATIDGDEETRETAIRSFLKNQDLMHCYHLRARQFVYDRDSNHRRQCWDSMYEFELCLEAEDHDGRPDMILETVPFGRALEAISHSRSFLDDTQWDEVNALNDDSNGNTITKCCHAFAARICLDGTSANRNKSYVMSYTVIVYHHQEGIF